MDGGADSPSRADAESFRSILPRGGFGLVPSEEVVGIDSLARRLGKRRSARGLRARSRHGRLLRAQAVIRLPRGSPARRRSPYDRV
jgi:hypothetical protein